MTSREKLDAIKVMCDETDEATLSTYLTLAEQKILSYAYPYKVDVSGFPFPPCYDMLAIEVAVFMLNKRGAEGESRHSENGIDRTYDSSDLPMQFVRRITPTVGVL